MFLFEWSSKTTNCRDIKLINGCHGPGWGEKADGKETQGIICGERNDL